MSDLLEDVHAAAEWIAEALKYSGYNADFSPASLWEVDRFFDEHSRNGDAVRGGLLSQDLGKRIFALGAYVGEVIRRDKGGEWHGDDNESMAEVNIELHVADGSIGWPVQRVMKRFKNGEEESIGVYGAGFGLDVGPRPERPPQKKPRWKFW